MRGSVVNVCRYVAINRVFSLYYRTRIFVRSEDKTFTYSTYLSFWTFYVQNSGKGKAFCD